MRSTDTILLLALAIAGFVFWRIFCRTQQVASTVPQPGAPPGQPFVPLGQYAVDASRRWLLIPPGQN